MKALALALFLTFGAGSALAAAPPLDGNAEIVFESRPGVKPTKVDKTKTPEAEKTKASAGLEDKQVALALANYYGVSVGQIEQMREQGLGYGELARAFELAKMTGKSVSELVALKKSGAGWGEIAKQLGVSMGQVDNNLGQILKSEREKEKTPSAKGTPAAPGKSGDNRKDDKSEKGGKSR